MHSEYIKCRGWIYMYKKNKNRTGSPFVDALIGDIGDTTVQNILGLIDTFRIIKTVGLLNI